MNSQESQEELEERADQLIRKAREMTAHPEADMALHRHLAVGDPTLCYQALAAGATARHRNDEGVSPMQALIRNAASIEEANLVLCASLLLSYGADPNERDPATGKTVLMEAAQHGNLLLCQLLLRRDADQHAVVEDANGDPIDRLNALDMAMCSERGGIGMDDVSELLLFYRVRPDGVDGDGSTAPHRLAWYVAEGQPDEGMSDSGIEAVCNTVRILAHAGAGLSEADNDGNTPLHILAEAVSPPKAVIRLTGILIAEGADVNARNNAGNTPLHLAVEKGRADWCHLLLEHGADPMKDNANGFSPEALARERGAEDVQGIFESHAETRKVRQLAAQQARAGAGATAEPS